MNARNPFVGLKCPKCHAMFSETTAAVDTVCVCDNCDAVVSLELRVIDQQGIEQLDQDVKRALANEASLHPVNRYKCCCTRGGGRHSPWCPARLAQHS